MADARTVLQVALDFSELSRALRCARLAVEGGADWLEAGTPLIKSEGLEAVRRLRAEFPRHTLVADMKTMDAGRAEVEMAAKAGADIVLVLGLASDSTLRECIEAARNYGCRVAVDLLNVADAAARAAAVAALGAEHVGVHLAIDEQMAGRDPFEALARIAEAVDIPVAVAGGINSETAPAAVRAGAAIVVVGGAVTKAEDPKAATCNIKRALATLEAVPTRLFKRRGEPQILEVLKAVSAANLSDALHRGGALDGIRPVARGRRMYGPVYTVRTYPGDWAKPVEAIDAAAKGSVIVIDAGGAPPAVWGELATESALQRGIAGVVIEGAVRDTGEIAALGFPAFARHITPNAGEPKGFGELDVPVRIAGREVKPGDFALGDDDGVVVLPREIAVEYANRAMDVLEKENRIRQEIREGRTLAKVVELLRWEKKR